MESYVLNDPYKMSALCNRRHVKPLPNLDDDSNTWRCLYAACFDIFWNHRRQFSLYPEQWDEAFMLVLTRAGQQLYNKRENGTSNEGKVGLYLAALSAVYSVFSCAMRALIKKPEFDNKVTPLSHIFDDSVAPHSNKLDEDDAYDDGFDALNTIYEQNFLSLATDVQVKVNSREGAYELYKQDCEILGLDAVDRELFEKRHIAAYYNFNGKLNK